MKPSSCMAMLPRAALARGCSCAKGPALLQLKAVCMSHSCTEAARYNSCLCSPLDEPERYAAYPACQQQARRLADNCAGVRAAVQGKG